jgi:DNA-binding SARP family transcriptional activator
VVHHPRSRRYRLDAEAFDVDLWRTLAAIEHADHATTDAGALTALQTAADAYHGEFADGIAKSWVLEYSTTYRCHAINVPARIAEIQETDRPDSALAALEQTVTLDPVCEELYQRIMRIQGRLGRVEAVRHTLERCAERLEAIQTNRATRPDASRRVSYAQRCEETTSRGRRSSPTRLRRSQPPPRVGGRVIATRRRISLMVTLSPARASSVRQKSMPSVASTVSGVSLPRTSNLGLDRPSGLREMAT